METLICNKCFAGLHRGKQPYSLTECGHIYCQICTAQAEAKCPQCQQVGVRTISLKKPLGTPQVAQLFSSVTDALMNLEKTYSFQENQMKILAQRFTDMDSKYEILKSQYHKIFRYSKSMAEKYKAEKARREELENKLAWPTHSGGTSLHCQNESIPIRRGNGMMNCPPSMGNCVITPSNMSSNISRNYLNSDGFRVPYHRGERSAETRRNMSQYPPNHIRR